MEQVLAPRFEFRPGTPTNAATPGFDYGEGGYNSVGTNVGINPHTGTIQLEIKGLAAPKTPEAERHLPRGPERIDHHLRAGQPKEVFIYFIYLDFSPSPFLLTQNHISIQTFSFLLFLFSFSFILITNCRDGL